MFFLMFLGVQSVNAQSFVGNTEAITILETELSDLKTELNQMTIGSTGYDILVSKINYVDAVKSNLSTGESVNNALTSAFPVSDSTNATALTFAEAQNQPINVGPKADMQYVSNLLQN